MFGPTEKVLSTLKNSSPEKEKIISAKKSGYNSIFEAIDKATKIIGEGKLIDPSTDDIATQQKKLYEISVKETPEGAEDKEGYQYLGSSAQENFYAKANYDVNTKKLLNIQVINSVDEEVANITNEADQSSAQIISDVVDQLRLDSVSFKMLLDVGAVDLEPDVITPADGGEGMGSGGPAAPSTGSGPTGAQTDGALGGETEVPGADGAQPGGGTGFEDEEEDKFLVGSKESKLAIPAFWAKSIKETTELYESKEAAKKLRKPIPEGTYKVIEKGNKISLVAKVITEGIASSKYRYLISNEDVNVSVNTPDGNATVTTAGGQTNITVDSNGGQEQISVDTGAASPAAGLNTVDLPGDSIDDASLGAAAEPVTTGEIGTTDAPATDAAPEGDFEEPPLEEDDEFEIPEGVNKGTYRVVAKTGDGSFIVEATTADDKKNPAYKGLTKKDKKALKGIRKLQKKEKKAKESVKEGKQVVKVRPEQGEGPWIADPMQIKTILTTPSSPDHIVDYVENGVKGVALLSQLQGVDIQVGPEVVKIAILDPSIVAAAPVGTSQEPMPITPAEAKIGREDTPASQDDSTVAAPDPHIRNEGKIPDVASKAPGSYIDELLEKHGLKEAETTPASREDAGGSASISKEGEGDLKMTGGINRDDKGGAPHNKTSTPASKEDDGGTASISKEGEGKLETGEINRDDKGGGPATAASGPAGAQADKGPVNNTGTSGSAEGGPQGAADSNKSTSTLEAYIAKLTKEMNEEKNPEIKATISETIAWLKSKGKK
jgi:hypothetical protein